MTGLSGLWIGSAPGPVTWLSVSPWKPLPMLVFGSDLKHFPVTGLIDREPGPVSVSKAPTPYTPSPASPGR